MESSGASRHVVVTGAAGFIGSHLVEQLLARGDTVTGIDNFSPFYAAAVKRRNLAAALKHPAFSLRELDVRDIDRAHITHADAVVHLAAEAGVRPSIDAPGRYVDVNVGGTLAMLSWAVEHGVPHFVLGSSSSVYGDNPSVPWSESDAVSPISPYAASKVSAEVLAATWARMYDLRATVLRFFTVYGPRQRPDLAIHKFARLMREGRPIPVFGDGSSRRDYTYVDDVVEGVVRALDLNTSYEVINLGTERTISLHELLDALTEVLGIEPVIDRLPPQMGDAPETYADTSRAADRLGFRPATDLHDGLRAFWTWLQEQED